MFIFNFWCSFYFFRNCIHFAAAGGNTEIMDYFIHKGNKDWLRMVDNIGNTPLHYAAMFNRVAIAEQICGVEKNMIFFENRNGFTPTHFAASSGSIDMIKLFFRLGDDFSEKNCYGFSPIYYAMKYNHDDVVDFILKVIKLEASEFVEYLQFSFALNSLPFIQKLFEVDDFFKIVNPIKWNITHFATSTGNVNILTKIFELADVEAFKEVDIKGKNVAHIAAINGNNNVLQFLDNAGLDILFNQKDNFGVHLTHLRHHFIMHANLEI